MSQAHQDERAESSEEDENQTRTDQEEGLERIGIDVAVDPWKAVLGGGIAVLVSVAGSWTVGQLHGADGLVLLQAMLPTTRFLCSAMMTATATILALMLTVLGVSSNASSTFHAAHFKRLGQIALLDMIAFIGATVLLLVLNIPLEESDSVSMYWYNVAYYTVLFTSSLLGGLLVAVVLMLYSAVKDMIHIFGTRGDDHPMVEAELD